VSEPENRLCEGTSRTKAGMIGKSLEETSLKFGVKLRCEESEKVMICSVR